MEPSNQEHVTRLLGAAASGDGEAASKLLIELYGELRQLAHARMRRLSTGQTLQPTALVHEAFVRLVGKESDRYENRRHFFFAAARAMEDILVEQARRKGALKRGGDRAKVSMEGDLPGGVEIEEPAEDMESLSAALAKLESTEPVKAGLVRLRYFAGLTMNEAAEVLGISLRTAEREWRFTRALLQTWLSTSSD
ncbi:MAG TPA: ECF-type sigma factor [Phycisphaerales bacterium]|nr:ECF-type sigma factor [Phycisphaerales bacterium]